MFKNKNTRRDFFFALTLIILVRFVYRENAHIQTNNVKAIPSTESSLDCLIQKIDKSLFLCTKKIAATNNLFLKNELLQLQKSFNEIQAQHQHKIKQEDAITYFLGPIYTLSKATKEHSLKSQLIQLQKDLYALQKCVDNQQENSPSYNLSVLV